MHVESMKIVCLVSTHTCDTRRYLKSKIKLLGFLYSVPVGILEVTYNKYIVNVLFLGLISVGSLKKSYAI